MFTTLVESRSTRARSAKGTMASVVLHGAVIAAAVMMTVPQRGNATSEPIKEAPPLFVIPHRPEAPQLPQQPHTSVPSVPSTPFREISIPTDIPTTIPMPDVSGPAMPDEPIILGGARMGTPTGNGPSSSLSDGKPVSENDVELVPRIIGNALSPRYPNALRESGIAGQVVVRFVVDTLGRAEMDGVTVLETSHGLFAEAVKNALGGYRFSPGEVGGRKVRTLVQLPFTFALK